MIAVFLISGFVIVFVPQWVWNTFFLQGEGPLALDVLGVDSLTVGTPDTFSFLFSFSSTPTEISMSVGPAVLGIGAVVGLLYAFIQSYRRTRSSADRPQANE